jgi:carboxymethylenebutenolidase
MAEVEFQRPDGRACHGYLAEPARGQSDKAVLIIHEMWGVTPQIIEVAERCAADGYRALVPDLFRGRTTTEFEAALAQMAALDLLDATEQDVRGGARWLAAGGAKVAAIGFCMGGVLAVLAAERVPELEASVCFYGVPPPELVDVGAMRIPLLGHFAEHDDWCTPAKVDALEGELRAKGANHDFHRYDARHAFMNRTGAGYSEPMAKRAWERTLAFLESRLG